MKLTLFIEPAMIKWINEEGKKLDTANMTADKNER